MQDSDTIISVLVVEDNEALRAEFVAMIEAARGIDLLEAVGRWRTPVPQCGVMVHPTCSLSTLACRMAMAQRSSESSPPQRPQLRHSS
jgi:hypothetical protein